MKFVERDIQKEIEKWINNKEILVIRGPRQSGKTTLLYQITKLLKKKRIKKEKIHFISLEDELEKEKFEKNPKVYIEYYLSGDKNKHFFLLDEVQYMKNAGKLLKLIYDSIKNIKIIITGSSTLDINEISSYLVGRALFFELRPFSFEEFLKTKDVKDYEYYKKNKFSLKSRYSPNLLFLEKLNLYLREYISYGGYPSVVLEKSLDKKKFLLKNLFLTYIEKDIVKVYGIRYKQRIIDLIRVLSSLNASIVNYNEICSITNFYYKELKEVISILEDTYIIKVIKPFHKNLVSEVRKNPKIYFIDTGLRNFITGRFDFSEDEFGKLLETYVLNQIKEEVKYWRTTAKAEVDFILISKTIPIEVKMNYKITRAIRSFILKYKPENAFVINLNSFLKTKINNTIIFIVPASLFSP